MSEQLRQSAISAARRQLLFYLAGTSLPVAFAAWAVSTRGGLAQNPLLIPLCMLTPMISAVVVQKMAGMRVFGSGGLGLAFGRLRWWALAPAGFALFVVVSLSLSVALSPQLIVNHAELVANVSHLSIPQTGTLAGQLALALVLTLLVAPLLNLPIFLGEETGWRGFMNPRLLTLFGRRGLILGGLVWALWHLPFILLGHNFPQHPWLGMAVWIPVCACLNIILHAIREAGRSILPCALSHGVMNQLATLLLTLFVRETNFIDVVHGPAGLIGLLVLLPAATWVYRGVNDGPTR